MMIAIKRKSIPWKRLSLQSPPHWLIWWASKIRSDISQDFCWEGRNGMIPHLNNAAYSKAEPHKNQFCFEQLLGTSFLLLTQDAVFSWQLVGNITGVSLHQSQHSLLLLWPQLLVNPYSSPLKNCVSRWHSHMPWRLEVALANRQDKVKGHHRSIVLWHEPNCLCTPQFLRLPFTCHLHRFQDTKATAH